MNFITGLLIFINYKGETNDLILVIIYRIAKIAHYELVKVTIDTSSIVKVIIDVVVWHHGLLDSIVSD